MSASTALKKAIANGGGVRNLAKALGIGRAAIYLWIKAGKAPIKRVPKIAEITGVPQHKLAPDWYEHD